ncbi:hypothetical protein BDN72DRAFT_744152, partial [Pluteus cervinus]
ECGCWVIIGAQHPNSPNPAIHYATPRLRTDAKGQVEALASQFSRMVTGLVMARRKEATVIAEKLQAAEKARDDATSEV